VKEKLINKNQWEFKMNRKFNFSTFARFTSQIAGRPSTFIIACFLVISWFITGPFFSFSNTWQLFLNTVTNIVTFLMVFIIQNTQNRDGEAVQIKLDELLRSHKSARNALLDLEELSQDQLDKIKARYEKLAEIGRADLKDAHKLKQ
jgi:low affinity Fe/Cu permease